MGINQEQLRCIRREMMMTQGQMAAVLHIARRTYQYYESLEHKMPRGLLDLLEFRYRQISELIAEQK